MYKPVEPVTNDKPSMQLYCDAPKCGGIINNNEYCEARGFHFHIACYASEAVRLLEKLFKK